MFEDNVKIYTRAYAHSSKVMDPNKSCVVLVFGLDLYPKSIYMPAALWCVTTHITNNRFYFMVSLAPAAVVVTPIYSVTLRFIPGGHGGPGLVYPRGL